MKLIDRNTILNKYQEICNGTACMDCPFNKDGCALEKLILESAQVEAEPIKHGQWKHNKYYPHIIFCSECGEPYELSNSMEYWNYCPNCRAKMDEEEEKQNA